MLPYVIEVKERGTVALQNRIMAAFIAKICHGFSSFLRQKLHQVSKITISSEEC